MSTENPCCHDCTDFPDTETPDLGCCAPMPVRKDCERPVLPERECDEAAPTITFDDETEEFVVTSALYDSECSALLDSTSSPLLALLA